MAKPAFGCFACDEAICKWLIAKKRDCFASLAMTYMDPSSFASNLFNGMRYDCDRIFDLKLAHQLLMLGP
jgi:hypothetical protein